MTTDQPTESGQPWGTPSRQRPRWSGRKTLAALGVAVVIAGGGGAAVYAATASDTGGRPGPGYGTGPGMGGPPDGGMGRPGGLADALHGEFVIADGSTRLLQTGAVTAISSGSVAVTSSDGYAKTYSIDASTVVGDNIQTGDQVTVIARQDGVALWVTERHAGRPGVPGQQPPATR